MPVAIGTEPAPSGVYPVLSLRSRGDRDGNSKSEIGNPKSKILLPLSPSDREETVGRQLSPFVPSLHHSITPSLHHSITPSAHHSITPSLHLPNTPLLQHSISPSLPFLLPLHHKLPPSHRLAITIHYGNIHTRRPLAYIGGGLLLAAQYFGLVLQRSQQIKAP